MDEYQDSNHEGKEHGGGEFGPQRWLVVAVVALLCIVIVAFAYGYHQQALVHQLDAQSVSANASVAQLQSQLSSLTAKLNDMTAQQAAEQRSRAAAESEPAASSASSESPAAPAHVTKSAHTKRAAAHRRPKVDTKYEQLQAQLADQQKQLKATQDEVAKDRSDLEGSINSTRADLSSTRDDLNGSIARTHDELVSLEKRGERSYVEFDLNKSKQFSRVGPLTLSLRKVDTKHKHYNLSMIVDDDQMEKKNVNLFEPIWIHSDESQPVQIVVNKIGKNAVHGYVSMPKYKPSEITTSGSAATPAITPVSAKTSGAAPATPNPQAPPTPDQPQQHPQQ